MGRIGGGGQFGRSQLISLSVAALLAIALVAGIVYFILSLVGGAAGRASATPTPRAAASPTSLPSLAEIFATPQPTVPGAATAGGATFILPGATPAVPLPPAVPLGTPLPERLQVVNTDREGVNLRRDPSTTAERIKIVPEGETLDIVGADRDVDGRRWRNVRTAEGDVGWIPAAYLGPVGSASSLPALAPESTRAPVATAAPAARSGAVGRVQIGNTGGSGINLRREPGGAILKTLPEGATVDALGPEREVDGRVWKQVRDQVGITGWVAASAIVPAGSVPTPVAPAAAAKPTSPPAAAKPTSPPAAGAPSGTPQPAAQATNTPPPFTATPRAGAATPTVGGTPSSRPPLLVPGPTATRTR
jgi:SH3-like domain-containing protein